MDLVRSKYPRSIRSQPLVVEVLAPNTAVVLCALGRVGAAKELSWSQAQLERSTITRELHALGDSKELRSRRLFSPQRG